MRLFSIRLIVSLIVGITLVSLSSSYYEAWVEKRGLRRDLERRAEVLGESLAGNVETNLEKDSLQDLQRIVEQYGNREHLSRLAGQVTVRYTGDDGTEQIKIEHMKLPPDLANGIVFTLLDSPNRDHWTPFGGRRHHCFDHVTRGHTAERARI